MSLTMNKRDGLSVVTVTSDPKCALPPLLQILKNLCFKPMCCSVSQHLRRVQGTSQSALGATQIMVGFINICLGQVAGNNNNNSWQSMEDWYPVVLGLLFAAFGTMSILSEKYPSPCLVIASVIANLAGVALAIAAIMLYPFYTLRKGFFWLCQRSDMEYWHGERIKMSPTQSVEEKIMTEKCREAIAIIQKAVFFFPATMSVPVLCLFISSAVLGIKSLSIDDPNFYKLPLLKEVTTITA